MDRMDRMDAIEIREGGGVIERNRNESERGMRTEEST